MTNLLKMKAEANSPWDTILPKVNEAREKGEFKITLSPEEISSLRNLPKQGPVTPTPESDWQNAGTAPFECPKCGHKC